MANFISEVGVRAVVYNLTGLRQGMSEIRREAAQTGRSLIALSGQSAQGANAVQSLGIAIGETGRVISTFGHQIANIGLRMSAFFTVPFGVAVGAVTAFAAQFEQQMVRIETVADASRESVRQWSEELLELGPELGQLPTQLAAGQYFIASVGIRESAEAMGALTVAAKQASIGMGDIEDLTRALAAAMGTFDLTAERAGDILLQVVREGAAESDELAGTIGRVLAVAKEAGVTFEEAGAFIATYTRTGVTAEVATTALRSALSSIIKPTAQARNTLAEYDLTIEDVKDSIEQDGLARTLIGLKRLFGENDQAMANVIGTQRGLAGVLTVTGELQDEYLEVLDKTIDSHGVLDEAFERTQDTFEFTWRQFLATLQSVAIEIGNVLLPSINSILQSLLPVIRAIGELASRFPVFVRLTVIIGSLVAVLGPAMFLFGTFVATIGNVMVFVGNLITLLGSLVAMLSGPVILGLGAATLAFGSLISAGLLKGSIALDNFIQKATSGTEVMVEVAGQTEKNVVKLGNRFGSTFEALAESALRWGANIITQLAKGMLQAAIHVLNALRTIAGIVADALRASSPPAILPDLPEWGAAAVESWLEGWTDIDVGVFRDIANTVGRHIRAIGAAEGAEGPDIASSVQESRAALARVITEFRELGRVSDETWSNLSVAVGQNSQLVTSYVQNVLDLAEANEDVTEAQDNLNRAQEHYSGLLAPMRDRLDEISTEQERLRRSDRRSELQRILENPRATDEVRRRARLELEELAILDQISDLEAERDTVVGAAQAELDAAQERRDAIQEQVEAQREILELIAEERNLIAEMAADIASIAGAASAAGGGGGGGGAGGTGDLDLGGIGGGGGIDLGELTDKESRLRDLLTGEEGDGETIFDVLIAQIRVGVEDTVEEFKTAVRLLSDEIENLKDVISTEDSGFAEVAGTIAGVFAVELLEAIEEELENRDVSEAILGGIARGLAAGLTGAVDFEEAFTTQVWIGLTGYDTVEGWVTGAVIPFLEEGLSNTEVTATGTFVRLIGDALGIDSLDPVATAIEGFLMELGGTIAGFIGDFIGDWASGAQDIIEETEGLVGAIIDFFVDLFKDLVGESIIVDGVDDVVDEFARLITEVPSKVEEAGKEIVRKFESFLKDIAGEGGVVPTAISDIVGFFRDLGANIVGAVNEWATEEGDAYGKFKQLGIDFLAAMTEGFETGGFVDAVEAVVEGAIETAKRLLRQFFGSIGEGVIPEESDDEGGDGNGGPGTLGVLTEDDENQTGTGRGLVPSQPVVISSGGGVQVVVNATINNDMDAAELGIIIRKELSRALRV